MTFWPTESRLCSYYAVASGMVPAEHWFALGRPISRIDNEPVLLSWSGTMFEYLMPEIFFDTHRDTLLGRSVDGAVRAQIAYGRWENIPWGISESAYYALDRHREYKYKAFGVYETALSSCPREGGFSLFHHFGNGTLSPREHGKSGEACAARLRRQSGHV